MATIHVGRRALVWTLVAAIAPTSLLGLGCDSNCGAEPEETFSVDAELTEAEIEEILEWGDAEDRASIDCATACDYALGRDVGDGVKAIHMCSLELSETTRDNVEEAAATVQCSGTPSHPCG